MWRNHYASLLGLVLLVFVDGTPAEDAENSEVDISICLSPRDKGDDSCGTPGGQRFYFDKNTHHCQPFVYAGCGGNENRFESLSRCKEACAHAKEDDASNPASSSGHGLVIPVPKCDGGVHAAIDSTNRVLTCAECPANHTCVNNLCCPSKNYTCSLEYDTGKYATQGSHTPRYFYSRNVNNCLLFTFYGALGNANNFDTYNECIRFCGPAKKQQPHPPTAHTNGSSAAGKTKKH